MLCNHVLDDFTNDWGPEIDREVETYVKGLQVVDLMGGLLGWSFNTERYFGKEAKVVKPNCLVTLLPRHK